MAAGRDIPLQQDDSLGAQGSQPLRSGPDAVLCVIRQAHRFAICSHARPDGDAVGAMLGCAMILEQLGKKADMVSADPVPLIYRGLPCAASIRHVNRIEGEYDAVILLECDGIQRSRIGGLEGRFLVNIDHHATGRAFGNVNWIDNGACAVAEMIYRLAIAAGAEVTPQIATCLYAGVLTDTGSFCYESTDAHAFEVARELVGRGADPAGIAREVYFSNPLSKMLLLGAALSNLHREGRLAWLWVTNQDMSLAGAAEEDCEGIVNYAIGVAGVEGAVLLRELPDHRVRLSLRSKGALNVARIAASLGGGGHLHAGGCTVDGPLREATDRILHTMRQELMSMVPGRSAPTEESAGNLLG
jgi:phosphoesterase RecJ-like protein